MKLLKVGALTLAVAGLLGAPAGHAQSIGIFLDEDGLVCAAQVGPTPIITLHVLAIPDGSLSELYGVQFRVTGLPETWSPDNVVWVADPGASVSIGNPLFPHPVADGGPGVMLSFNSCRADGTPPADSGPVSLGRILILSAPTPEGVVLRVEKWQLFPDEVCPLFLGCDFPDFSPACVEGGEATLNGDSNSCRVATAVEETTWSAIRVMYR